MILRKIEGRTQTFVERTVNLFCLSCQQSEFRLLFDCTKVFISVRRPVLMIEELLSNQLRIQKSIVMATHQPWHWRIWNEAKLEYQLAEWAFYWFWWHQASAPLASWPFFLSITYKRLILNWINKLMKLSNKQTINIPIVVFALSPANQHDLEIYVRIEKNAAPNVNDAPFICKKTVFNFVRLRLADHVRAN